MDNLQRAVEETRVGGDTTLALAYALIDIAGSLRAINESHASVATALMNSQI